MSDGGLADGLLLFCGVIFEAPQLTDFMCEAGVLESLVSLLDAKAHHYSVTRIADEHPPERYSGLGATLGAGRAHVVPAVEYNLAAQQLPAVAEDDSDDERAPRVSHADASGGAHPRSRARHAMPVLSDRTYALTVWTLRLLLQAAPSAASMFQSLRGSDVLPMLLRSEATRSGGSLLLTESLHVAVPSAVSAAGGGGLTHAVVFGGVVLEMKSCAAAVTAVAGGGSSMVGFADAIASAAQWMHDALKLRRGVVPGPEEEAEHTALLGAFRDAGGFAGIRATASAFAEVLCDGSGAAGATVEHPGFAAAVARVAHQLVRLAVCATWCDDMNRRVFKRCGAGQAVSRLLRAMTALVVTPDASLPASSVRVPRSLVL